MFWRLFVTLTGLLLGSIALLGAVLSAHVERHLLEQIESSLHTKAILVRELVQELPATNSAALQERMLGLHREIATRITLIAADGRVLADSQEDPVAMDNHGRRPEVESARQQGFATLTRFSTTVGEPMMYAALRVERDSSAVAFVRVALPLDRVEEKLAWLHRVVCTTALVAALGAMALASWLARRIAQPLQELTVGAQRVADGDYGRKVYVASRDEFGTLASTFNHMSERLKDQIAQLQADHQQLRTILSGMVEGVVALDWEQRILFANDRAAQLLEFHLPTSVGRKLWEVVRHRPLQEIVNQALANPAPRWEELNVNGKAIKNLAVHVAQLTGLPARGAIIVLQDTSELRRLERVRQEFVANVSHELKTPLSVIKACVETLLDGAVDDPEHRGSFLQQIGDQSERLHRLILDLLSLARIEGGTEVFEFESVNVAVLVGSCLERYKARAEAKNQRLEALGDDADLSAWADEEAVGQILDNLVDNALKYTSAGGQIRIRWQRDDGQVRLEVEDTGLGIPDKDLPRIFERFYRVDKARSREMGGTGLGLSIVKHLVQAMDGSVRVTSRIGQGTKFAVELPVGTLSRSS